jgi:hypothetical protein
MLIVGYTYTHRADAMDFMLGIGESAREARFFPNFHSMTVNWQCLGLIN